MTTTTTYKILENVPVPALARPGRAKVYPFETMKVGDCFDVPLSKEVAASSAICKFRKEQAPEWKFTRRKLPELGVMRIWRTA